MLKFCKKLEKFICIFLVVFCQTLQCVVYRWCDPYETFCLFSYGPNVTVSNLTEAQQLCTEAKNGSWPIEITNDRIKNIVTQFMINNSFSSNSSVYLNAEVINNKWVWIENNEDVRNADTPNNVSLCFRNGYNESCLLEEKNAVICNVTKCKATWISFDGQRVNGATTFNEITNVAACKEKCETDKSLACTGFEFTPYVYDGYPISCWIHTRTDLLNCSKGNLADNTFQVINRTSKSIDICIGNISEISIFPFLTTTSRLILLSPNATVEKSGPTVKQGNEKISIIPFLTTSHLILLPPNVTVEESGPTVKQDIFIGVTVCLIIIIVILCSIIFWLLKNKLRCCFVSSVGDQRNKLPENDSSTFEEISNGNIASYDQLSRKTLNPEMAEHMYKELRSGITK